MTRLSFCPYYRLLTFFWFYKKPLYNLLLKAIKHIQAGADWPLGQSGATRAGANILLKWAGYTCSGFFIHLFNLNLFLKLYLHLFVDYLQCFILYRKVIINIPLTYCRSTQLRYGPVSPTFARADLFSQSAPDNMYIPHISSHNIYTPLTSSHP